MKKSLSILCFLYALSGMAQDHIIPLWEGAIPNAKKSELQETQIFTDAKIIKNVIIPTVAVYLPAKGTATGMAILICPGGGYSGLAIDKTGTDIAKWLNGYGIAGVVLKYRLPEDASNEAPCESPLMDAKRGMEIIRSNAKAWNLNPDKIGVIGFSAGGHLASTLGTHFETANRPYFMALIYPVVTMKNDYTHQGSRRNLLGENPTKDLVDHYSNELQVTNDTPPTFIVHCEDDPAVPVENSLQMFQALRDHKIPAEMHVYPKGGHGFAMGLNQPRLSDWSQLFMAWLKDL